jgi:hypothetical protein
VNGTLSVGSSAVAFVPEDDIIVNADGELVVAASAKLTVAAGKSLTVADGGSITLTGDADAPGTLVLAAVVGDTAKAGGGGKLVLTGGGTALGTAGAIQPAATVTNTSLTATGSAKAFTLPGASTVYSSIGSIATTGKGFTSIEAATVASADAATNGAVTFKGGSSGTDGTLDKAATLQSTT